MHKANDTVISPAVNENAPVVTPPKKTDYKSKAGAFKFGGVYCRVLSHFADNEGHECFKLRIIGKKQTRKRFVVGGEVKHGDFMTKCVSTSSKGMEGVMRVTRELSLEEKDAEANV